MWASSYSKVFKGLKREVIWQRWADVNTWPDWIPNLESCKLEKPFVSGNSFRLKPKGSSEVVVRLMNVKKDQTFTGCTRFFGATMYDIYEMHQDPQGLRLTITLKVTGPLGFLWRKLVAEKIEANLPTMLKNLAGVATMPDYKKFVTQDQQNSSTDHKPKLHVITSNNKVSNKGTSKSLKKTNPLLMSTPEKSTTANRKVESSMFTATQPKLSTPTPKPIAKKPKAKAASSKKAQPKKASPATKKAKTKVAKPKKTAASKATKSKVKKTTAKKATAKKATAKKATSKTKTAASKKAKAKSSTKAKKVSAKPKTASKAKSKPKTAKAKTAKSKAKA